MTKQERHRQRREARRIYDQAYSEIRAQQEESIRPYAEALEQARVKAMGVFQAKSRMIWQILNEELARVEERYQQEARE